MTMQNGMDDPVLSPNFQSGDSNMFRAALEGRAAREARKFRMKKGTVSMYTEIAQELVDFAKDVRDEIKKDVPAPFGERKLTREQQRARLLAMSPEEAIVMSRRIGPRQFAEMAMGLEPKSNRSEPGAGQPGGRS